MEWYIILAIITCVISILSFFLLAVYCWCSLDCCNGDENAEYQAPVPYSLSVRQDKSDGFDPYNSARLDKNGIKKIQTSQTSSQHPRHRYNAPRYLCSPKQGKTSRHRHMEIKKKLQPNHHQVDKMKLTKYGFRLKFLGCSTF